MIPSSLLLLLVSSLSVGAVKVNLGGVCEQGAIAYNPATLAFDDQCDAQTYCAPNSNNASDPTWTCQTKGCRRDEYPFGYGSEGDVLPPRCDNGEVCPDNMAKCEPQVAVGQPCQLARDDECLPPPNQKELESSRNVNGSVCLKQVCYYSDVEVGQACVFENLNFVAFRTDANGQQQQVSDIRSKDNCKFGGYCDGSQSICIKTLNVGEACSADKTCSSYNCGSDGKCVPPTDGSETPPIWVYIVVAIGIVAIIVGTLVGLYFIHRRSREEYQVKLEQYYTEQVAYRESLFSLSHTRDSLLSLPKNTHPDVARQSLLVPSQGYSDHDRSGSPRDDDHK